jgi:DNA-binding Lrp family transcriptional regulator
LLLLSDSLKHNGGFAFFLQKLRRTCTSPTPEIKGKIKLSREHTARLMKKLYESGYLERETSHV